MTKSELIDRLAAQFPATRREGRRDAVQMILDARRELRERVERIEIAGSAVRAENIVPTENRTQSEVFLFPATRLQVTEKKHVPHFKAGKEATRARRFKGSA